MDNKRKKQNTFKFIAMSKLIGLIAFSFVLMITIYAMVEMHNSGTYDALPQLIISAFGFASIYAGFYLTMAKVEHVEEEKTLREKELKALQHKHASEEDIQDKKNEIDVLRQKMTELLSEQQNFL